MGPVGYGILGLGDDDRADHGDEQEQAHRLEGQRTGCRAPARRPARVPNGRLARAHRREAAGCARWRRQHHQRDRAERRPTMLLKRGSRRCCRPPQVGA